MMKRLSILILPLLFLASARAEEWRSDAQRCAITLPDSEPWQKGNAVRLPSGEMIFSASNMDNRQAVTLVVIPDFPTNNVGSSASIARFTESIAAQGFEVVKKTPLEWNGLAYIQIVGRRLKDATGELVSVTRATIKDKTAFLVSTYGRGDESRLEDERFMRVMKTFRFLDGEENAVASTPSPFMRFYRIGYSTCAVLMFVLMTAFFGMYYRTRRQY